jgi:hypothetical protein
MQSISTIVEGGAVRNPAQATEALHTAYRSFFDTPNGQLVLADLAVYSGWDTVSDLSIGALGLAEANGKRTVFARINGMLNMTADERAQLAQAVKRERGLEE